MKYQMLFALTNNEKVMISTLRVNNLLITGLIPVPLPVLSTSLVLNKMAVDQN